MAKFATRIGLTPCTVKRYRTVFRAWKEILQKSAPGLLLKYSVARALAGLPDRESLIKEMPAMTTREAIRLRDAHNNHKNETEEMDRWFRDVVKRANKDQRDEKYLDVDPDILRKVIQPSSLLNTLLKGGEARIRLVAGLKKICDDPANAPRAREQKKPRSPSGNGASLDTTA